MTKVNITIGRFQPFTIGHLNMIKEGERPCIVYRINSSKSEEDNSKIKVKGKVVKKDSIERVVKYLNGEDVELNEIEKDVLKRPFTNDLIEKELDIVKKNNNKYFVEVVYVKNAYEALCDFNARVSRGEYECEYLMCGDDRKDNYEKMIESTTAWKSVDGEELENVLKGKLKVNVGKGRTKGVSGTAVRECIRKGDKNGFASIMPQGTSSMFDAFVNAFATFKALLEKQVKENKYISLKNFICEWLRESENVILEGGAGGHMAHPFEYDEFTCKDLCELVESLFGGKIEGIKEKLDGMNIHATMNNDGKVVFIRNKSDLNSEQGGMDIQGMIDKWSEKPSVMNNFVKAGQIIEQVFKKLGSKYFNPTPETRKVVNCECITMGKTNVMPYAQDRVAFHGYKLYERGESGKWIEKDNVEGGVEDLYNASQELDATKPRPNIIVKNLEDAQKFAKSFIIKVKKLFKEEGLGESSTIDDWKRKRFNNLKPDWLTFEVDKVYNRWFNDDKSFKATELKKLYGDHYDDVKSDKFARPYIRKVMEPMDELFLELGNVFINICDGFTNQAKHSDVIKELKKDMQEVVDEIEKNGSEENRQLLQVQLERLRRLGEDSINSAEGIVFTYKGKLMKLTGSFAAVNQILGTLKFSR